VKQHKGDEEKITATISEWWEEPQTVEPEWEDVNKKGKKAAHGSQRNGGGSFKGGSGGGGGRSGSYRSGGGGRGFYGRGMGGGRGAGPERRYGSGGERERRQQRPSTTSPSAAQAQKQQTEDRAGVPAPVKNVPRPQGAWGQGSTPSALATASAAAVVTSSSAAGTVEKNEPQAPLEPEKPVDPGVVTAQDPTPAGLIDSSNKVKPEASPPEQPEPSIAPVPTVVTSTVTSGNVWATKGSAHLIEAEKPKPPPIPSAKPIQRQPQAPSSVQEVKSKRSRPSRGKQQTPEAAPSAPDEPTEPEHEEVAEEPEMSVDADVDSAAPQEIPETEPVSVPIDEPVPAAPPSPPDALDSVLPASVNGANVNAAGWEPLSESSAVAQQSPPATVELAEPSPVSSVPDASLTIGAETTAPVEEQMTSIEPVEETPVPSSVLPKAPVAPVAPVATTPANVLNMGRWDAGDGDDDPSLDFGFGSFGAENDVASVDETSASTNTVPAVDVVTSAVPSTEAPVPIAPAVPAAPPTPAAPPAPAAVQPSDVAATTTSAATKTNDAAVTAATVSPARPPPGLSIGGGMPPMPANAVHLHELEEKFESANLTHKTEDATTSQVTDNAVDSGLVDKKPITTNLATATQTSHMPVSSTTGPTGMEGIPSIMPHSQNYGYGMGMYNYGAANVAPGAANGFVGVHGAGPVLAGVVPQQQQQKPQQQSNVTGQQQAAGQSGHQSLQQPQSLYGAPSATGANVGAPGADATAVSTAGTTTGENAANAAGALPPGMPGAMPYNPAVFYGQQHYQMGQPHGGVGYGYGYGQFGGAVQGGYAAYQQVMSQSGAYGQPYDEQPPQQHHNSHTSHHTGGSHQGGYQKNNHGGGGGYRRNTHHNNHHSSHHNSHHTTHGSAGHQYQNQYNPQQLAGYGAQPYNMGYSVDHFNQRAGYGPGNVDHYGMGSGGAYQTGIGQSGFNQDSSDQQQQGKNKSKSGNSRTNSGSFGGNPNMQQYQQQQVPPQQQGGQAQQQQQPFGLQGGVTDASGTGGSAGGWPANQNWGQHSWQQS